MPPVEQVEFNRVAVALPSINERVVRLAYDVERVERPGVEVGDEAEDGSNVVAKDSRSEVSTVNQTCHVEYTIVLLVLLRLFKLIPFCRVAWVDPGLAFVDLENLLTIICSVRIR